ncbi:hypothetical protein PF005_g15248 [Phytophthora fragariae]|uniref:Uncharacterized protein n=1 Tax=Phytophthora fragariae TaxID=53985 RepID=A0A6A3XG55_9STRA|nr:hypothetical protein PF003_g30438 [Phytophthora fragariae]KAE8935316.1 hypothetical protein PF009_g14725 [Phytophthora fragariae]KAE9006266.1 hypothetical protein PF011_g11665 [Phytophthora fragariae]KAE9093309.1 hypothetical protein PF010_g17528 [Phytophthora fragariae]KAE9104743.1 hypothetical protein PF007_g13949 [Phytophthora fragariae]
MIVVGMGVNNQVTNSQDATCCWRVLGRQHAHWLVLLSCANLNTAVTLAHCVYDRLSWWKVPGYMLLQLLGAFLGAIVIYVM